jgi:cell division protein FtsN
MDKKPRFFIYDRREVAVLVLLGLMVAVFAFTLGVHLGKRAGGKKDSPALTDAAPKGVEAALEASPSEKEIEERARAKQPALNGVLNQATEEEIARTGVRLDAPRQVALPSETRAESKAVPTAPASRRYVLQIGSYPSIIMAQVQVHVLEARGFKPAIQKAQVAGMGTRFRVMIGDYLTRKEAEKAGALFKSEKKVDTFIVARSQS